MTRSDLIEYLSQTRKLPKGRSEQLIDAIFDSIEGALMLDERVEIRGFGSFEVRHYGGYIGRNPRTGSTAVVKPKKLPFFKVGRELRERVNPVSHGDALSRKLAPSAPAVRGSRSESPAPPQSAAQPQPTLGAS